ncbi:MAG: hypothetical protein ACWGOD_05135 [Desulfobulbales bacterium]
MRFRFFLSDPQGDIELSPEDLKQPFLISPQEQHPFLTLKDYFDVLQKFVLSEGSEHLRTELTDTSEVIICSEKHGAFYHISSIATGNSKKFVVISALSEQARASLKGEYLLMQQLANLNPDFLPELYWDAAVNWHADSGSKEFYLVLGEWLNGYHEWHLSYNPKAQKQQIQLWDYENGYRFLSQHESYEILRQAACILTFYYDQASFCQIYPWHHGAGDFVVKAENGSIRVKLITARQYEPLIYFEEGKRSDRLVATIHFLLNLSLRIRLDRCDGTGEPAWFNSFAVQSAVAGFVDGLNATKSADRLKIGPITEFMELMHSFDTGEIGKMYESLLPLYAEEDQEDFQLIQEKIADHAEDLHAALQNIS